MFGSLCNSVENMTMSSLIRNMRRGGRGSRKEGGCEAIATFGSRKCF